MIISCKLLNSQYNVIRKHNSFPIYRGGFHALDLLKNNRICCKQLRMLLPVRQTSNVVKWICFNENMCYMYLNAHALNIWFKFGSYCLTVFSCFWVASFGSPFTWIGLYFPIVYPFEVRPPNHDRDLQLPHKKHKTNEDQEW